MRQGDIIRSLNPKTGKAAKLGVVITADCDIAQRKASERYTWLEIVPMKDYIEGPFDDTIKTANFPVLSGLVGLAFAGKSPFQAEIYFINLAGNIRVPFRVPYFDVADPRFSDFPVKLAVGGSYIFNITDYKSYFQHHPGQRRSVSINTLFLNIH